MSVNQRSRTYSWEDPIALRDAGSAMSGLEFLKAVFDGKLPPPPIAATMDFTGAEVEEGRAVFVGEAGEFLYNPIGVVHGGFAMTMLDSAMGCAVQSTLAAGVGYTSLETSVNFVRPITRDTGRVRCEATVLHKGGRIATAEGRLIAEKTGKLLAHGTSTCLILSS
ncbi:MAG: PaaI family thioesterase [Candidatus Dormibacteraeota bacterium]|nr:PaaI family thioesterase [Candidatus Dormibacteraeota bacterium]